MRLALFSAFPHELNRIVKNLEAGKISEHPFKIFFAGYSNSEIIIAQTGMGIDNAEAALKYILEEHRPDFIISAGFCGALFDGASIGGLICASSVSLIDNEIEDTLELPDAEEIFGRISSKVAARTGSFMTLKRRMKKAEIKKILPRELPFPVCDMETFPLAKISAQRGLPFFAIRSITDRADEDIPRDIFEVSDETGNYKLSRALKLLLSRPKLIPGAIRLGINSKTASENLWNAVKAVIEVL